MGGFGIDWYIVIVVLFLRLIFFTSMYVVGLFLCCEKRILDYLNLFLKQINNVKTLKCLYIIKAWIVEDWIGN